MFNTRQVQMELTCRLNSCSHFEFQNGQIALVVNAQHSINDKYTLTAKTNKASIYKILGYEYAGVTNSGFSSKTHITVKGDQIDEFKKFNCL